MSSRRKHAAIRRANERADAAEQRRMLAEYHFNVIKSAAEAFAYRAERAEKAYQALLEQVAHVSSRYRAAAPIVVDASTLDAEWLAKNLPPAEDSAVRARDPN